MLKKILCWAACVGLLVCASSSWAEDVVDVNDPNTYPAAVLLAHLGVETAVIDQNDPNSDVLVVDASGNGNDGLLEGGAALVSDPLFGSVLDFSDVNDRIAIVTDGNFIEFSEPFSMAFWVKTDANTVAVLSKCNDDGTWAKAEKMVEVVGPGSWAYGANGLPEGGVNLEGAWCNATGSSGVVNDGAWHHVAITWVAEGGGAIYIDGVLDADTNDLYNGNFADNAGDMVFIGYRDGYTDSINGSLADVRLYEGILTAAEVNDLAVMPSTFTIANFDTDGTGDDWLNFGSGGRLINRAISTDTPDDSAGAMQIDVDGGAAGWGSAWGAFPSTGLGPYSDDPNNSSSIDGSGYTTLSVALKSTVDGAGLNIWLERFPGNPDVSGNNGYTNEYKIEGIGTEWAIYEVALDSADPVRGGLHDLTMIHRMSFGGLQNLGEYTILLDNIVLK